MSAEIFTGLESIRKRDSSRFRKLLFARLQALNWRARLAHRAFLVPSLRPAVSAALVLYSLRRFFQLRLELGDGDILVFHYPNEKRAVERALKASSSISYEGRGEVLWLAVRELRAKKLAQWARVSMRLLRRNGFLVGARQTEFLALYGFFTRRFESQAIRSRTFLSASESNPEVIAATLAAKKAGNRLVYVAHSALERELGVFFHDEIRVPGAAYVNRVLPHLKEPARSRVVVSEPNRPPSPELRLPPTQVRTVGVACSIIVDPLRLESIVRQCLDAFPEARIVVRAHPNRSIETRSPHFPQDARVRVSERTAVTLAEEARDWDFAIAGNSSAHLDLLGLGVPTIHMNIDGIEGDLYDFIGSGLVPRAEEATDIFTRMTTLYSGPAWRGVRASFIGEAQCRA
jgi:hypothetical protein